MVNGASLLQIARKLLKKHERLLPPNTVLERCRAAALNDARLLQQAMGTSGKDRPIEAFSLQTGHRCVLLYGFPDPGEAVGGTVIVALLEALLTGDVPAELRRYEYWFVPVANPDEQPDRGETLAPAWRDPKVLAIDWCVDDPRPETTALLTLSDNIRPEVTLPLHDELHAEEELSAYLAASAILPRPVCDAARDGFVACGQVLHQALQHPEMGTGFYDMREAADYERSTFSRFAEHGVVMIPEVAFRTSVRPLDAAAAQLTAVLAVLMGIE